MPEHELSRTERAMVEDYIQEGLDIAERWMSPEGQIALARLVGAIQQAGETMAATLLPVLTGLAERNTAAPRSGEADG